jgi:hypothetical protein
MVATFDTECVKISEPITVMLLHVHALCFMKPVCTDFCLKTIPNVWTGLNTKV